MPTCVISISSRLFYIVFFILIITQSYCHSLLTRSTLAARLALTLTASTRILKLTTIPTAIATTTPSTAINQSSELCFRCVYHIITSTINTHTHTHTHSTLALTPTAYTRMLTLVILSAAITTTTTTTTTKPSSELCFPCVKRIYKLTIIQISKIYLFSRIQFDRNDQRSRKRPPLIPTWVVQPSQHPRPQRAQHTHTHTHTHTCVFVSRFAQDGRLDIHI